MAASAVAVVGTSAPPAAAAYEERWCGTSPAPCVQSFTVDGVAQTAASPIEVVLHGPQDLGGYRELNLATNNVPVGSTAVLSVVINTGSTFVPDRMFGQMGLADVDTGRSGGTNWIRITGTPVSWAEGCDSEAEWPWPCPATATAEHPVFGADIAMLDDRRDSTIGMYVGTNAAFNGIFFTEGPDGNRALTTQLVAPHTFSAASGFAVIVGSVRYRLSYDQMREDFEIPNPTTLSPGSLSGTINGGSGGGTFTTWHDPDGGGFFIEASGFTFSLKKLRVSASHINPTKPRITKTVRTSATRATVKHSLATARGAKVKGYVARCNTRGHKVTATGSRHSKRIKVAGLRPGRAYKCRVAAQSKTDRSAWSRTAKIAARPRK